MRFNLPKNDSKYYWTQHCVRKMMFYGLTADRVKRIVRNPKRMEDGVAENTVAVMQPSSAKAPAGKAWKEEIWVMYSTPRVRMQNPKIKSQNLGKKIIISAWRYPGVSPVGKQIPIPEDILEELKKEGMLE